MANAKERLDELETGFGMMQDEMTKMREAMIDKFRFMEESIGKVMEGITSNHERDSSTSREGRGTHREHPRVIAQQGDNFNPLAPPPPHRHVRLEFTRFQGGDPTAWLSKAKQYFAYQELPMDQRVNFASYHLEEEANEWWQATSKALGEEKIPITWDVFEEELWARFGPSGAENFDEALSKINQKGSLREYHREFERLQNKVTGWTQKALIGTYIGGLKDSISDAVRMFRPTTLKATIELARMRDDQLQRSRRLSNFTTGVTRNTTPSSVAMPRRSIDREPQGGNPKKLSWDELKRK